MRAEAGLRGTRGHEGVVERPRSLARRSGWRPGRPRASRDRTAASKLQEAGTGTGTGTGTTRTWRQYLMSRPEILSDPVVNHAPTNGSGSHTQSQPPRPPTPPPSSTSTTTSLPQTSSLVPTPPRTTSNLAPRGPARWRWRWSWKGCGPWSRVEVVVEGAVGGREVEFDRSRPLNQNPDKTSDRGY